MVKIITDSTSYLPKEIVEQYDITILSHRITINGKEYNETELTNITFFEKIKMMDELPVSNPPSQEVIATAFEKEVAAGNTVIGIFIAGNTSETVTRAKKAKDAVLAKHPKGNITVIDSESTCMALGIVALAAAERQSQGAWLEDVVDAANAAVLRNRLLFIPKDLDHLAKSGKIGKAKALIGNVMQLIPLLTTSNGQIAPLETIRTRSKAIDRMVEIMKEDSDKFGIEKVVVTHVDDINEALVLSEKIGDILRLPVEISEIGPSVGVTVGPGTLGLIYSTSDIHPLNM